MLSQLRENIVYGNSRESVWPCVAHTRSEGTKLQTRGHSLCVPRRRSTRRLTSHINTDCFAGHNNIKTRNLRIASYGRPSGHAVGKRDAMTNARLQGDTTGSNGASAETGLPHRSITVARPWAAGPPGCLALARWACWSAGQVGNHVECYNNNNNNNK